MPSTSSQQKLPQAYDYSTGRWLVLTSVALVGIIAHSTASPRVLGWAVPVAAILILAIYIDIRRSSPALVLGLEGIQYVSDRAGASLTVC